VVSPIISNAIFEGEKLNKYSVSTFYIRFRPTYADTISDEAKLLAPCIDTLFGLAFSPRCGIMNDSITTRKG
jgi:hypothetical protein